MSIIVPSNHTRIGAWVNSKMSGRNPLVYCTIPLTAMQGYRTNTVRGARVTTQFVTLHLGSDGCRRRGFTGIDLDVILEIYYVGCKYKATTIHGIERKIRMRLDLLSIPVKQNRGNVVHHQACYYRNGKTILFYITPLGNFIQYCSVCVSLYVLDF